MDKITDIMVFNKLFSDYHALFTRFANTYIQDTVESEDIVSEGFVYYWENRQLLSPESNIPAYILEIIKHKCLNHLRHLRIREDVESGIRKHLLRVNELRIATLEACDPHEIFSAETQALINEALAMMPEKTRKVFTMSRYENKSYAEIAEYFSFSTKSVEFHISKALHILRVKLKDYIGIILFL